MDRYHLSRSCFISYSNTFLFCPYMVLLPITIEHVIDERSPLHRHTHDSLVACGAEVVVTFEAGVLFRTSIRPTLNLILLLRILRTSD